MPEARSVFQSLMQNALPRSSTEVIRVSPNQIQPNAEQARRYFDTEKFNGLKASIQAKGILVPLVVRPISGDRYEIIAGERRYRAAIELELPSLPVISRELDDQEAAQLSLIENLQRADLNPVEETEGVVRLLTLTLGLSHDDVVAKLNQAAYEARSGIDETSCLDEVNPYLHPLGLNILSFANNRLPLLKLPEEILEALQQGKLEYTKARAIGRLKEVKARQELLREAVENNLTLKEIRGRLSTLQHRNDSKDIGLEARTKRIIQLVNKHPALKDPRSRSQLEKLLTKIEVLLQEPDEVPEGL